jgi:uncharacterized protein (DUF3084 family)
MDDMAGADRYLREISSGIRLILEEIREERRRADEDRKGADEDRRQANEDRRQANEDRKRADEDRKRADQRFEEVCRQAAEDRKNLRRLILMAGNIGMDIRRTLAAHTALLQRIVSKLDAPRNGRGRRNGRA